MQIEARLRQMEGRDLGQASATTGGANGAIPKYDRSKQGAAPGLASTAAAYNPDADVSATAAGSEKKKKVRFGTLRASNCGLLPEHYDPYPCSLCFHHSNNSPDCTLPVI